VGQTVPSTGTGSSNNEELYPVDNSVCSLFTKKGGMNSFSVSCENAYDKGD